MAKFEFKNKKIYYETHGETGYPIVLLNGIMMSTLSWHGFVPSFSANNRLILMDFFDQGQSDKYRDEVYNQDLQVAALKALLEHLNLEEVALAGISYGGNVALKFAAEHPSSVSKLVVFNVAAKTGDWLKELGESWIKSMDDPVQFYNTTIPVIYSPEFYNNNPEWVKLRKDFLTRHIFTNKEFLKGVERLTNSANDYDVSGKLDSITAKTLIVASEFDPITPVFEHRKLHEGITNSEFIILPNTGHATMYERPAVFASLLLGFINTNLEALKV
ncbi:MAG: alpha/beta hydrolase [Firmicutes bacterium]|nr:alpha/beta hydrolase [Bacillota bacterium]